MAEDIKTNQSISTFHNDTNMHGVAVSSI